MPHCPPEAVKCFLDTNVLDWILEHPRGKDLLRLLELGIVSGVTAERRLGGGLWLHGSLLTRAKRTPFGRWLSEDPLGIDDGVNLYAYVHGNPVNRIDPDGLRVLICYAVSQHRLPTLKKSNAFYGYCIHEPRLCLMPVAPGRSYIPAAGPSVGPAIPGMPARVWVLLEYRQGTADDQGGQPVPVHL